MTSSSTVMRRGGWFEEGYVMWLGEETRWFDFQPGLRGSWREERARVIRDGAQISLKSISRAVSSFVFVALLLLLLLLLLLPVLLLLLHLLWLPFFLALYSLLSFSLTFLHPV